MIKDYIEQFFFFPNKDLKKFPSHINIKYEDIYVQHSNEKYHGWFIEGNEKNSIVKNKCILFFHGNAGNISFRLNYIEKLYTTGFSLLFFDYPGFGLSDGIPNENNCILCSDIFFKYLITDKKFDQNNIIYYGESIGGSIASSLANQYNIKYLIVQSTFTDIKEIINKIISFNILIINNIGFNTLNNLKKRHKLNILNKKMKTLIIHSPDDELIDYSHAEQLALYSNELYKCNGSHSNVNIDSDFIFNLLSFIKE
jgi:pimeloyl-ACP methyl ester carboxylesterase